MKKWGFFIVVLFIVSCSVKKKPIFIKVDDIKIMSIASDTIRLKATAFFKNPNDIGGKLATDEIKVIVNGEEVAQVSSDEFEVPARKEFNIPLKVVIPAKKIFGDTKNGILGGLINSILTKSIKVQFKGDLKYRVLGFSDVYPIDKTEDIKIKF
ncbi:NDR1/HIN1-like protein [Tenacibaculum haliotis]|uniref:NDR1/HIN1-like protein n=1 Tax=Tenacibaculum haliotis TaxID=1888914 RepID=UPI0021B064FE|nr:LEA type 2 family protein [Tenacibaculum haliotis]MCT4698804.1 LEA type 2 family protein [Tenacibaculum haliotis]